MIRGGFLIRKATELEYGLVLDCFKEYFWPEKVLTMNKNKPSKIEEEYIMDIMKNCTNLLVFDMEGNDKNPIGFTSSGKYRSKIVDEYFRNAENLSDRMIAIQKLNAELEKNCNIFKKYNFDEGFYTHWGGVSHKYGQKTLGTTLMEATLELAKEMEYKICFTDTSSNYAERLCKKIEMEFFAAVNYKDFLDENGKQVFNPPSPHKRFSRYVKVFK